MVKTRRFGIQLKTFIAFGLFFTVVVAGGGWAVTEYFASVSRNRIARQQFDEVGLLARAIDDRCRFYLQSLEGVARQAPVSALEGPRQAQAWLSGRAGIRGTFENGTFLFSPEGRLLASDAEGSPESRLPERLGPFLRAVGASRRAAISEVFPSRLTREPALLMAAPILRKDGRVAAILAGSVDLLHDDFLGEISRHQLPNGGYLQVFDARRRVLIHPDRSRLMKPVDPYGHSEFFERSLQGFEGSMEGVDPKGASTIASAKRLQTFDGVLMASVPMSEAFRPIEQVRSYLKVSAASVVAMSLMLTWLISHRLAENLEDITGQIQALDHLPAGRRVVRIEGHDEINLLAESFNHMIGRLEANEAALLRTQARTDEELAITKHLLQRLVEPGLQSLPSGFHMATLQTQRINGDACAYREGPPGIHFGLLCDATGHGLAAGISTMPAVHAFLSMASRDIPLENIYLKINERLRQMLPTGRFVCLMIVRLDLHKGILSVLNAGLPDLIVLPRNGEPRTSQARNLPAGVLDDPEAPAVEHLAVAGGDRFLAYTDGLQDTLGERLEALLEGLGPGHPLPDSLKSLREALEGQGWDQEQQDDVSWALWESPLIGSQKLPQTRPSPKCPASALQTTFSLDLTLDPRDHPVRGILPDCLRLLGNQGLPPEAARLLTLALTEALTNAVDHGLLRLDPRLKETGADAYESARREALERQVGGVVHLRLGLRSSPLKGVCEVAVEVEDSGPGFDWRPWLDPAGPEVPSPGGRGLRILRSISRDMGYNERGNQLHFTLPCG